LKCIIKLVYPIYRLYVTAIRSFPIRSLFLKYLLFLSVMHICESVIIITLFFLKNRTLSFCISDENNTTSIFSLIKFSPTSFLQSLSDVSLESHVQEIVFYRDPLFIDRLQIYHYLRLYLFFLLES